MSPAPAVRAADETLSAPGTAFPQLALLGNPNTGKTTLFNQLCGLRAKTANFPGTTTDARVGRCELDPEGDSMAAQVTDLPGTYRIHLELPEARVCHDVLLGRGLFRRPDLVVIVVDATNLARNLMLVGEAMPLGCPIVVALNMVDLAQRRGLTLDPEHLAAELGCPVVPIMARKGEGVADLRAAVRQSLADPSGSADALRPPEDPSCLAEWADGILERSSGGPDAVGARADSVTDRLDQAFTHPWIGVSVFALIMAGLFWTVFSLASVPMDLIEWTFGVLGGWLTESLPAGAVRDLLVDGVVGGVAGTVVFLPQICLLFFLISLLEDTGYLARAAFVMDRILCRFGLPGHAFVPLLSSHACALPGIMSTRLIPDRQDRLATILVAPFMSCSARLPVYVLLTTLLFADRPFLAGLAFAGCYLLGATAALVSAWIFRRSILPGRSRPMVLELPSYKIPSLRTATYTALQQGWTFLEKAGTVIVAICIVMWWLSTYPRSEPPPDIERMRVEAQRLEVSDPDGAATLLVEANRQEARAAQARTFVGYLGRGVEPVLAPLGFDWQLSVGVLTSFLAREVFVSTMAVLLEADPEADPDDVGVIAEVRNARRDDGRPVFTRATSASCLVFFVLAMQCLPTLALVRKEARSTKWAVLQLAWMTGLAWVFALITYQGLTAFGVT